MAFPIFLFAQKDTEFWFVAPEISSHNSGIPYDSPTRFVVGAYENAATVTLSMPANPAFSPIILNVAANSSGIFDVNSSLALFENKPPNQVLNKGVLIQSTAPVSVYYELNPSCGCNPDLFALKGKNALGIKFFAPFQTLMDNSPSYTPLPYCAFDIVATENNTTVTINPAKNIFGHNAGTPFTIILNKGQTYSGAAPGQSAAGHPSGSKIESDKPIAITVKDDLLEAGPLFGNYCRDAMGDQLIPVSGCGTKYIMTKGVLNGIEKAFVVATANNTQISYDGAVLGNLDEGETMTLDVSNVHYLESDAPVILWQISGFGCEVGGAIIPTIDCSGSSAVRFIKSTDEGYFLMLTTETANQDNFLFNGIAAPFLTSGGFSIVPGTNGGWVSGLFDLSNLGISTFSSNEISNSSGLFHLGIINGGDITGCRFGFFSDFGKYIKSDFTVEFCAGDTVTVENLSISTEGVYFDTIPGTLNCDTILRIEAKLRNMISANKKIETCPNLPFFYQNNPYFPPATIIDTLPSATSCDTLLTIEVVSSPFISLEEMHQICPNQTFEYDGEYYSAPATIIDTIFSATACDTVLTILLSEIAFPKISREIALCPGETVTIAGKIYDQPATVIDTLRSLIGCDTIRMNTILLNPVPEPFGLTDTIVCTGDKILLTSIYPNTTWNNSAISQSFEVNSTGLILVKMTNEFGCSRTDLINVRDCCGEDGFYVPNTFSPNDDGKNDFFQPFSSDRCHGFEFSIFDRWGELIYQGTESGLGWDGKFRGKSMLPGVYVWVLKFRTGIGRAEKLSKGNVSLVR